ncbi:MAG: hypothetical protein Ct9H300mP12_13840 [Acidimicrobiales bacterium]|nr:MAG: hypothetical protein Ct9H300mP12_13840 [Acidimicrobiales bacterium]
MLVLSRLRCYLRGRPDRVGPDSLLRHWRGQPYDTGHLVWDTGAATVTDVRSVDGRILHSLAGPLPEVGTTVAGQVDDERRWQFMRTHTAMHVLCGVMWPSGSCGDWREHGHPLGPHGLRGRSAPRGVWGRGRGPCNAEIAADRPIEVSFIPRADAVLDRELIRPRSVWCPSRCPRSVVDIVGLDRQADGGTHVSSTGQVGRLEVVKTESKGKGFKRIRFVLHDA